MLQPADFFIHLRDQDLRSPIRDGKVTVHSPAAYSAERREAISFKPIASTPWLMA